MQAHLRIQQGTSYPHAVGVLMEEIESKHINT